MDSELHDLGIGGLMRARILPGFVSPRQPELIPFYDNDLRIPHHE